MSKRILILLIIILSTTNVYSQWEWVHPKPCGTVFRWCKILNADTFYVAGEGGIFAKTYNAGTDWMVTMNAGYPGLNSYEEIFDGEVLASDKIILVGLSGAMMSTNGGVSFDSIPGTYSNLTLFDVFFLNSTTGFICGASNFLKKTTDGGETWNSISTGINGSYRSIHTLDDTDIIISHSSGNIIKSSNGGVNWEQINTGGSGTLYSVKFINNDTVVVSGSTNVFRISTNKGATWMSRNPTIASGTWYNMTINEHDNHTNIYLFGSNNNYILKSSNLGESWDTININYSGQNYFNNLYSASILGTGDTLLAVGNNLVNMRKNNQVTQMMQGVRFGSLLLTPQSSNGITTDSTGQKIWAAGEPQIPGSTFDQILYSSNGGNNWIFQSTVNSSATFFEIQMLDENTGYTVGTGGEILKTINGGLNWNSTVSPTTSNLKSLDFINAQIGWIIGEDSALYKTTDGGNSWSRQHATFINTTTNCRTKIDFVDENTGWLLGATNTQPFLNKTTDGGQNWFAQDMNTGPTYAYSMSMINANTGFICADGSKLRKTTNGGVNWEIVDTPYPNNGPSFIDVNFKDELNGVVRSTKSSMITSDGGINWSISTGIAQGNYSRIKLVNSFPNPLCYTTSERSGVMKYGDIITEVINWIHEIPTDYQIYQNFPNPFNPVTTIEFAIPKQAMVSLKIFDIAGREIKTLIDRLELSPGTVKQTFDGSNLASGVYFYSLIVDNKVVGTKKMVLMK